jgi:hypothetical protein
MKLRFHAVLIVVLAVAIPTVAPGQQAPSKQVPAPSKTPAKPGTESFRLRETEITGKLQDVVGSFKLLETEIVGTLERPKLSYIIPWREPEPFLLEETDFKRGFLNEIYTPVDKELYTREIDIRVR